MILTFLKDWKFKYRCWCESVIRVQNPSKILQRALESLIILKISIFFLKSTKKEKNDFYEDEIFQT